MSCWRELGSPQIDSPAVRDAAHLIGRVYHFAITGGGLHIVVDDYNLDDADLDSCLGQPLSTIERKCGEALRRMTVAERASALGLFDGYWRIQEAVA